MQAGFKLEPLTREAVVERRQTADGGNLSIGQITRLPHDAGIGATGPGDRAVRFPTSSKSNAMHVAALALSLDGTTAPASTIPTTTRVRIPELSV